MFKFSEKYINNFRHKSANISQYNHVTTIRIPIYYIIYQWPNMDFSATEKYILYIDWKCFLLIQLVWVVLYKHSNPIRSLPSIYLPCKRLSFLLNKCSFAFYNSKIVVLRRILIDRIRTRTLQRITILLFTLLFRGALYNGFPFNLITLIYCSG